MSGVPIQVQTFVDPWESPWYTPILERVGGMDIMLGLTMVYLGIFSCLRSVQGWVATG